MHQIPIITIGLFVCAITLIQVDNCDCNPVDFGFQLPFSIGAAHVKADMPGMQDIKTIVRESRNVSSELVETLFSVGRNINTVVSFMGEKIYKIAMFVFDLSKPIARNINDLVYGRLKTAIWNMLPFGGGGAHKNSNDIKQEAAPVVVAAAITGAV